MKKKIIIIIMIILLVTLIVVLLLMNKNKTKQDEETPVDIYGAYNQNRENEGKSAKNATAYQENNMNEYYTVKGIIDKFSQNILYLNGTATDIGLIVTANNEKTILEEYKQAGLKFIKNVLAPNYKEKYSVNDQYILNALGSFSNKEYVITDMFVVDDSDYINTYFIYGSYGQTKYNFIIILDRYNNTYEIYLDNYINEMNYSKDELSTMKTLNITSVEKNESNSFQYKNIEREQIVTIYYEDYLSKLENNVELAYSMLDSSYKTKRFETLDSFKKYIANKTFEDASLENYTITQADGYVEYVCNDTLGNIFVFKATSAMKYTVLLDTYTTAIVAYENEYKNADVQKKVELSFNRFFECINNKDYEAAYNYLNKTYRETEFPTLQSFEEYVTSIWFNINLFKYNSIQENSTGTYIVYGTIKDYEDVGSYNAEKINKTFYIKLGSNYNNFEISFGK